MTVGILGIDIGGVLKDISWGGIDGDRASFLSVPPKPNAFEVLRELSESSYKDKIWVISKCQHNMELLLKAWLIHHEFYKNTLIKEDNVIFVRDDEGKTFYAKAADVTHFIDDQIGILTRMSKKGIDNLYLFKPEEKKHELIYDTNLKFIIVRDWYDIYEKLLNESEV